MRWRGVSKRVRVAAIFAAFVPTLCFIHMYNGPTGGGDSLLNKRIAGNVCGWSLVHVAVYWAVAAVVGVRSVADVALVFGIMVLWYAIEWLVAARTPHETPGPGNRVYCDPYQPRPDDIFFNSLGLAAYVATAVGRPRRLLLYIALANLVLFAALTIYTMFEKPFDGRATCLRKDGFVRLGRRPPAEALPEGYVMVPYKYTIVGSALQTFHRDVTSSQYQFRTRHPTYTYAVYGYDGAHLAVCPGSHCTVPLLFSRPEVLSGQQGDGYLFNCDVVHSGVNGTVGQRRRMEQYKFVHKDDAPHLGCRERCLPGKLVRNYTVKEAESNQGPAMALVLRKLSLVLCVPINHVFTPLLQDRPSGALGQAIASGFGGYYNSQQPAHGDRAARSRMLSDSL